MSGFTTRAIHTPFSRKDAHGALHMPVYDAVTFEFDTAEDIAAAFQGKSPRHAYSRITNPTVEHFERKVRNVTGASSVLAVSSGMAAIANVILALARRGENVITSRYVFGNTFSLLGKTLEPWGLELRTADLTQLDALEKLINEKTRVIFFETITNPQLEVVDIRRLSEIARRHRVVLVSDTTVTPLTFFNSREHGIDIEVLSSTKFISGGATTVGGLIIDNGTFDWKAVPKLAVEARQSGPYALINKLKREVYRNLGSCLSPHNAFMQSLGLETIVLRAERACRNTLYLARFLARHPLVKRVNYPGLSDSPFYEISRVQFGDNAGAILTCELASQQECFAFINRLKLVRRATNINDNKTLAIHPASTIFCEYAPEQRVEMGVPDTLVRIAVGIEDVDDIIADISQALEE